MHYKIRGCDFAGTQSKPKRLFCHVFMAGNVYAGFHGLAANADQIATGWGLASIRSTASDVALNSENSTAAVGQLPMSACDRFRVVSPVSPCRRLVVLFLSTPISNVAGFSHASTY